MNEHWTIPKMRERIAHLERQLGKEFIRCNAAENKVIAIAQWAVEDRAGMSARSWKTFWSIIGKKP